jgi:DNA-binding FadR family transcriptional regulator
MELEQLELATLLMLFTLELQQALSGLDGSEEARLRLEAATARHVAARDVAGELLSMRAWLSPRV